MADQALVKFSFNGDSLAFHTFRGRRCVITSDLGRALEYSDDGKELAHTINKQWLDELIEGTDYDVLTNDDLREFKTQLPLKGESPVTSNVTYAPHLTVLYESGVDAVCLLTKKPIGKKLRRFLINEVLPKLRRGETINALASSERVEQLEAKQKELESKLDRVKKLEFDFNEFRKAFAPKADSKEDVEGLMDALEEAIARAPGDTVTVNEAIGLNLELLRYGQNPMALARILKKYRGWIIGERSIMGVRVETGPVQWWVTHRPASD